MFPKHVLWNRLILLLCLSTSISEAISKTDDNLYFNSGPGTVTVTCPSIGPNIGFECYDIGGPNGPPALPLELTDGLPTGDLAAFQTFGGDVTGAPCGTLVIMGFDSDDSATFSGCDGFPITLTRRFEIYDDADNNGILLPDEMVQTCLVLYLIEDELGPTWDVAAGALDQNITCASELSAIVPPTATDNCTGTTVNVTTDVTMPGNCADNFTRKITFVAVDDCGNESIEYCINIVSEDNIGPSIDTPAMDEDVSCDGAGNLSDLQFWLDSNGGAVATDNCGNGDLVWTNDFVSLSDDCATTGTATVNFTVSDGCGNNDTTTASFTISDNSPPTLVSIASNLELECNVTTNGMAIMDWINDNGGAEATDNCGFDGWSNNFMGLTSLGCGGTGSAMVTFEARDICGNMVSTSAAIIINDTTAPVVSPLPDVTLSCGDPLPMPATTSNEYTMAGGSIVEMCSNVTVTSFDNNNPGNIDICSTTGGNQITRTYTVQDACGRIGQAQQVFTYATDANPPVVDCSIISSITVECGAATALAEIQTWVNGNIATLTGSGTDDCGFPITTTSNFVASMIPLNSCSATIDIDFTLSDICGNETVCTESINVNDTTDPVLVCPPNQLNIACGQIIPGATTVAELIAQNGNATDNCGIASVSFVDNPPYSTLVFCQGNDLNIERTYTIVDNCGRTDVCTQILNYLPSPGPVITSCPPTILVDANTTDCTYVATLTPPTATSACSSIVSITSQYPNNEVDLEPGNYTINWTVQDACGSLATCSQTLIVQPNGAGLGLLCEGQKCGVLDVTGSTTLYPQDFVLEVTNECGSSGPFSYAIARMTTGPCNDPTDTQFDTSLDFCCEDIGTTIMVFVQVSDNEGNVATCMTEVEIKDQTNPVLSSCPSNQMIECEDDLDLDNLSAMFGMPIASDNCPSGLSLVENVSTDLDDCGVGTITRVFVATDASGNMSSCSQTLTVVNINPFNGSLIDWPDDITLSNGCNTILPGTDQTGLPTYPDTPCSQLLVNYSDDVGSVGPGCTTIIREWVIIDWCQFDNSADPSTYRWESIQIINLEEYEAPVFDTCPAEIVECGNEETCMGMLSISASATDNCALPNELVYTFTFHREDGLIINGSGNTFNSEQPYGNHSITWYVSDQCGNSSSCTQSVIIKDCKAPTAVCLFGININLTVMPGMEPMAVIWATDFDASSYDNCTPTDQLEFAFDENFTQSSLTFDCSHAGGTENVILYVRDADGNVGFCKSYIGIQDNHGLCTTLVSTDSETVRGGISGKISREDQAQLEEVTLSINSRQSSSTSTTNELGEYAFDNLPLYEDYTITPNYKGDLTNGLSTLDIIMIQQHILDLKKIESPYKLIAADVNNSASVTAADIVDLRKVILGIYDEFPNNSNWRFVDQDYAFHDLDDPFPIEENTTLSAINKTESSINFIGIKTGDVNTSALIEGFIPESVVSRSTIPFTLNQISLEKGHIQFTVNNDVMIHGFQLTLSANKTLSYAELSSKLIDIHASNYEISNDLIQVSWSSAEMVSLEKGQVLFTVKSDQIEALELSHSNDEFANEAYNQDLSIMGIQLDQQTDQDEEKWMVYRNNPNPFSDKTFIPFEAPKASEVSLTVYDVNGVMVYYEVKNVPAGYQRWELDGTTFGHVHGVLYYRLESGDYSSTQPFIKLK